MSEAYLLAASMGGYWDERVVSVRGKLRMIFIEGWMKLMARFMASGDRLEGREHGGVINGFFRR